MKKMVFSIFIALFGMSVFVSNIFAQSNALVRLSFTPVSSLAVGELLTLPLTITAGKNVAGYQATVSYDTSALRYVSSKNGDYLPQGAFFVPPIVKGDTVTLAATALAGNSNGDGTLATLTFEVVVVKASTLTLSEVLLTDPASQSSRPQVEATEVTEAAPASVTVRIAAGPVSSPIVTELLTLPLTITAGENVAGYQATVSYDTSALRYVSSKNGDYLPQGAFFVPPIVKGDTVTLAATALAGESNGDGTLATLTFEVLAVKASTLTLSDVLLTDSDGQSSRPQVETTQITEAGPSSGPIGLTLPSDLISEVAFGTNSTYFVLNAQFPTLTGINEGDVIYGECLITLDLPGVPTLPLSNLDNLSSADRRRLNVPAYFMYPLKSPQEQLDALEDNSYLKAIGNALGTSVASALAGAGVGSIVPGIGNVAGAAVGAVSGFVVSAGVNIWKISESKDRAKDEILRSTADPFFHLVPFSSEKAATGKPTGSMRYLILLPERVTDLQLEVSQSFNRKDGSTAQPVIRRYPWNLAKVVLAAPSVQARSLMDYPPFQLLPPEVQTYLLWHFPEFANAEVWQIPEKTSVLSNYPNPFNPETWIPYQLASPAHVSISIYSADGRLVRTLALGYQPVGIYESRSRAAYWDGRNTLGEPVASGVYFYTLTAGDFTATRKMLIRK